MTVNSMASMQINQSMIRIASGQRINSAADDAAGLAIAEKLESQIRGLDRGTENTLDMQNLVNTAEGGLSSISDNLQRMRELTLQASNGIYTDGDRQQIQKEIDQIMSEIDSVAQRTEFNTMPLLDGGFSAEDNRGLHTASDANGRGPTISIGNMGSGMILGPDAFDVTDTGALQNNLQRVDNALAKVTSERSYLGAMSNRLDSTVASNQITNLNLAASKSRIADQDIGLAVMKLEQDKVTEQAQTLAQKRRQEREQQGVQMLSALA